MCRFSQVVCNHVYTQGLEAAKKVIDKLRVEHGLGHWHVKQSVPMANSGAGRIKRRENQGDKRHVTLPLPPLMSRINTKT